MRRSWSVSGEVTMARSRSCIGVTRPWPSRWLARSSDRLRTLRTPSLRPSPTSCQRFVDRWGHGRRSALTSWHASETPACNAFVAPRTRAHESEVSLMRSRWRMTGSWRTLSPRQPSNPCPRVGSQHCGWPRYSTSIRSRLRSVSMSTLPPPVRWCTAPVNDSPRRILPSICLMLADLRVHNLPRSSHSTFAVLPA